MMSSSDPKNDEGLKLKERKKTARPKKHKVLLHNDDYTTMEFVVYVLMQHFQKDRAEATQLMLQIHHKGLGVAGVYPKDIAETKANIATEEARAQGMPLLITSEPE